MFMDPFKGFICSHLQVTVSGCVHDGALQLEGINKRDQGGQTAKLDALIDLCHLRDKDRVRPGSGGHLGYRK